jgi:hypothetical protein
MCKMKHSTKLTLQFIFAWLLMVIGVTLLFFGFFVEPTGEIHPSVLTAFGEISTLVGAILGIDYRYKFKTEELDRMSRNKTEQEN